MAVGTELARRKQLLVEELRNLLKVFSRCRSDFDGGDDPTVAVDREVLLVGQHGS